MPHKHTEHEQCFRLSFGSHTDTLNDFRATKRVYPSSKERNRRLVSWNYGKRNSHYIALKTPADICNWAKQTAKPFTVSRVTSEEHKRPFSVKIHIRRSSLGKLDAGCLCYTMLAFSRLNVESSE
ncbi:hypothetical protein CDL15_Pgr000878 [Punica granatum]|uniref:Uncharacterized protein n=1 Tax=Punica granatum TaxID=22663 RepID=A0A218XZW9_PUNGR|nr:hypothetical protein CDL15_Pgr000878 [Punica granatum]